MITVLTGEDTFEIETYLNNLIKTSGLEVEKVDGSNLLPNGLPDLLMGVSLFAPSRLVLIKDISLNKAVWPILSNFIDSVSDDNQIVLIESKLDKRTSTYKKLKLAAKIIEFNVWADRDYNLAERWVEDKAKEIGLKLDKKSIQFLVSWVGLDKWNLYNSLLKLELVDSVSVDVIRELIDPNPLENIFNLLETAIKGDIKSVKKSINLLKQNQDIYALFGLMLSQVFQLAAVYYADNNDNPVKDFSIHPYVYKKLSILSKELGRGGIEKLISTFYEAETEIKTTRLDPFVIVENALIKIAS